MNKICVSTGSSSSGSSNNYNGGSSYNYNGGYNSYNYGNYNYGYNYGYSYGYGYYTSTLLFSASEGWVIGIYILGGVFVVEVIVFSVYMVKKGKHKST